VAHTKDGDELPYDLFVGIPVHRAPQPLQGWLAVDQGNLRTEHAGVYAVGDVSTGARTVPKAGIFAEAAARVVADDILAEIGIGEAPAPYEGWGICYAEFGDGLVSKVEVNFLHGDSPVAERREPSQAFAAEKAQFGASRRARWFGA
jgi:sulfide:quinone oxidoreductase